MTAALLVIPAAIVLGTTEASAQRGLYKGWMAPAKYRTTEERRFTIGGGLPTGSFNRAKRHRHN
jgi:hypothetical protein